MKKLLDLLKSLGVKWKALSALKKTLSIAGVTLLSALIIVIIFYSNKVTYKALFYNLDSSESANILQILEQKGISYKVAGDTIYVPEDKVDELRITIYSDEYSSSKGYELFDESTFGLTDTEASVMYQRALETELARTISSIDGIKRARVHLVLPEDSVFVSDTQEATASITLKLQAGFSLNEEQVKAIISMVSGSVENLPKHNIQVIDNNLNLLSDGIYDDTTQTGVSSATDQQEMAAAFEKKIEKEVVGTLEAIFGNGNVKSTVNADMNFDSTKITEVSYDPKSVIRSQTNTKDTSTNASGGSNTDTSPVDNNMQNTTEGDNGGQAAESSSETNTTSYEIPQTEKVTIKAPGEVKRMTVSVVIDGTLNESEKTSIQNIVAACTGYKEERGDIINVAAYTFNTDLEDKAQSDLEDMKKEEEKKALTQKYTVVGAGALALIILIIISSIFVNKRVKKNMQKKMNVTAGAPGKAFEAVVGEAASNPKVIPSQPVVYNPILEDNEVDMTLDKEIKDYVGKKPDQAIDVIKSWLAEDER
jgi:flagellar M-ring protein FliF